MVLLESKKNPDTYLVSDEALIILPPRSCFTIYNAAYFFFLAQHKPTSIAIEVQVPMIRGHCAETKYADHEDVY